MSRRTLIFTTIAAVFGLLALWTLLKAYLGLAGSIELTSTMQWTSIAKIFVFVVMAYGAWAARKDDPFGSKLVFYSGATVLLVVGVMLHLFGERWVSDPMSQNVFDLTSGEPNYMEYLDNDGKWKRGRGNDGELLKPEDCRPEGVAHDGFNYELDGICHAQPTGRKMTSANPENVPILPNLSPFKTPAEVEARRKAKRERLAARTRRNIAYVAPIQPQAPSGSPTAVVIPACGNGWGTIEIPAKWRVTASWNTTMINYQQRAGATWYSPEDKSAGDGFSAVRYCAKAPGLAGTSMPLTWGQYR